MVHTKEAVLMLDTPSESGESCVLGSTILRSQIVRIQFCSKMPLEVCQEEMWDVSAAQDRSILAWAKKVFIYSKKCYQYEKYVCRLRAVKTYRTILIFDRSTAGHEGNVSQLQLFTDA